MAPGSCALTLVQEVWGLGSSAIKAIGFRESPYKNHSTLSSCNELDARPLRKYLGWAQGLGGLSTAGLISLPSSPASAVEPDSHHPPRGLEVKVSPSDEQGN